MSRAFLALGARGFSSFRECGVSTFVVVVVVVFMPWESKGRVKGRGTHGLLWTSWLTTLSAFSMA